MTIEDIKTIKEIKDIEKEQNIVRDLYNMGNMNDLKKYVNENIFTKYQFEVIVHESFNPIPARTNKEYFDSVMNFLETIKKAKVLKSS